MFFVVVVVLNFKSVFRTATMEFPSGCLLNTVGGIYRFVSQGLL